VTIAGAAAQAKEAARKIIGDANSHAIAETIGIWHANDAKKESLLFR
jgi:hypothetical protein